MSHPAVACVSVCYGLTVRHPAVACVSVCYGFTVRHPAVACVSVCYGFTVRHPAVACVSVCYGFTVRHPHALCLHAGEAVQRQTSPRRTPLPESLRSVFAASGLFICLFISVGFSVSGCRSVSLFPVHLSRRICLTACAALHCWAESRVWFSISLFLSSNFFRGKLIDLSH
jgi:hypothetical protein